ncbi:MAG: hypothetical protein AAGB22_13525, partial [Bacteroidota bacterium]
ATGTTWVVHNHPRTNIALVTMAEFCRGNAWFVDEDDASADQDTVISNAVYFLEKGLPYSVLRMNCQHTSSMIAQGKKYSEDLRKFTRALVVATPPLFWLARTFLRLVR